MNEIHRASNQSINQSITNSMQLSVCQLGVSVLLFRTEDDSICICLRLRQYNQSTKKILSEILWRKKR